MANGKKVKGGKKAIKDLAVKDVETAEAKAVTGGADGKVTVHDISITKFVDKSTSSL